MCNRSKWSLAGTEGFQSLRKDGQTQLPGEIPFKNYASTTSYGFKPLGDARGAGGGLDLRAVLDTLLEQLADWLATRGWREAPGPPQPRGANLAA